MTTYSDLIKKYLEANNIIDPSKAIEIKPENPRLFTKEIVWYDNINENILVSCCTEYDLMIGIESYLDRATVLKPIRYKEVLKQLEKILS